VTKIQGLVSFSIFPMALSDDVSQYEKQRPRLRFTVEASARLASLFESGVVKPNKALREQLATELQKTPRSIQIWFQNKRAKLKRPSASPGSKKKGTIPSPLNMNLLEKDEGELESSVQQNSAFSLATADESGSNRFPLNSALYPLDESGDVLSQVFHSQPVAPVSYVSKRSEIISGFPNEFSSVIGLETQCIYLN
jgi:hypothetical protein